MTGSGVRYAGRPTSAEIEEARDDRLLLHQHHQRRNEETSDQHDRQHEQKLTAVPVDQAGPSSACIGGFQKIDQPADEIKLRYLEKGNKTA